MSEENQSAKRTIEVDTEFLESLYGLVGKIPPGEKGINVDLLKDLILDIKRKFGKNAVIKGMDMFADATGQQRNRQIGGHAA